MRHLAWLAGCLLVLSCMVNNDNLNGGSGGSGAGTGGAGGCPRCAGTGGATATGGQTGAGGAIGGHSGSGGASASGGQPGTGGSATGGQSGGNGTGGNESCGTLESNYNNALTSAKKCTQGAANQCQQLVDSSLSCPGCKQYVNDTTMLSVLQTAWNNQGCSSVPHACPAIACVFPQQSVCSANPTSGGPGPGPNATGTCAPTLIAPAS